MSWPPSWDLSKVLTGLQAGSAGRRGPSHTLDRGWTPPSPAQHGCTSVPLGRLVPKILCNVFRPLPPSADENPRPPFLGAGKGAV